MDLIKQPNKNRHHSSAFGEVNVLMEWNLRCVCVLLLQFYPQFPPPSVPSIQPVIPPTGPFSSLQGAFQPKVRVRIMYLHYKIQHFTSSVRGYMD